MNVDEIPSLDWDPKATLEIKDIKSVPRVTTILPEYNSNYFDTPCTSFFSFLPVAMWEKITFESNSYAHEKMRLSKEYNIAGY